MPLDSPTIAKDLAARGLRLTRQRLAVIEAVTEARGSVSPIQVFDSARRRCPDLGLTTVYRTLEVLGEIGAVRRVHGPDHCEAFAAAGARHGHCVICSCCGRVSEFTECDLATVVAAAARQTGYRITEHVLQLSGICAECQAEAAQARRGTT